MTDNLPTDALGDALRRFETNLETPVIPGELSTWLRSLHDTCDVVRRLLCEAVEDAHEQRYRQISEQDPEMLPRVQQLRDEDQELLRDSAAVADAITSLEAQNGDRVANQANSEEKIAAVIELGLAFVIRARTQETALSTWYMEAFQRDRGIAD